MNFPIYRVRAACFLNHFPFTNTLRYKLQQDNAPAHRANEPVEFLSRHTPDYIAPWLWAPNSPDLNPVDYTKYGGVLQERVCHTRIRDLDHLKQRLIEEWSHFDQRIVDRAVHQWRVRLRECVRAKRGHLSTKCNQHCI